MSFKKITAWARYHWAGIILSLIIGAIVAAPPIIWHFSAQYQGVEMLKTNTEAHYVAQIREVFDGHTGLGNPFFADLKNTPYLFPPLSPNIIARFGQLLGLTPINTVMTIRFMSAAFLSFLIYLLTVLLTGGRRLPGLLATGGVVLGYNLLDPSAWHSLFNWSQSGGEKTFIDYGRPINPSISSLFFFGYLVCLVHSLKDKAKYGWLIAAAIIAGLTFYVYLFTWTFIAALNGFLILTALIRKDYSAAKRLFLISVGMGLMGIPYFLHTLQVSRQPFYKETVLRFGFVKTHAANISRTVIGAGAVFLLAYRRLTPRLKFFFSAFFITALFVVNEQIITGQFIFNHHFHWYFNTPLLIIFGAIIFDLVTKKLSRSWRVVLVGLGTALCLYNGIIFQIASYRSNYPVVVAEQRFAPVFNWLNNNTPKDSTVFATSTLSILIPAVTHNNIYFPASGIYTLVSNQRLLNIYAAYAYLRRVPSDRALAVFESKRPAISGWVFGYTYYFQPGICDSCFPSSVITDLAATYRALNDQNFMDFVKQYPVDYLVWDTKNDPDWRLDRFGLREAVRLNDFIIYYAR